MKYIKRNRAIKNAVSLTTIVLFEKTRLIIPKREEIK